MSYIRSLAAITWSSEGQSEWFGPSEAAYDP